MVVSRKRVHRLMRIMGLRAIYRKPGISRPTPGAKVYPYLEIRLGWHLETVRCIN